jgi:phosphoribosylaminoimidazole carboxylase (NCAIR synthetase)
MFDNELFLGTRMSSQLWVEPVGELVLARLRGMPTEALFVECQRQVLQILRDRGGGKVLYDALEMEAPPVEVALSQRTLDETLGALKIRRAIVVPTRKLAYLARLAFGQGNYRVFYNDISAAINWLGKESSP